MDWGHRPGGNSPGSAALTDNGTAVVLPAGGIAAPAQNDLSEKHSIFE